VKSARKIDPFVLAQKCFELVETMKTSGTYKFATFLALLRVIERNVNKQGQPPQKVKISDIGCEVMKLYWSQAVPFKGKVPLKQGHGPNIVTKIRRYRTDHNLVGSPRTTMNKAEKEDPTGFKKLEKDIIKTVADMPIQLLQKFGNGSKSREELFLYKSSWKGNLPKKQIETAYLNLKPGVGEGLKLLTPLLETQIKNQWMEYVSDQNKLDTSAINDYLFGFTRSAVTKFAKYLLPLQGGKCFYCATRINQGKAAVDHVIPWSLSHDDGLDNLVASCVPCNSNKSATLPGLRHLKKWSKRLVVGSPENLAVTNLAVRHRLFRDLNLTHSLARAAYAQARPGTSVWNSRNNVVNIDISASLKILA